MMLAIVCMLSFSIFPRIISVLPEANYHTQVSLIGILALLGALNIWILTYTVLPLVRIDSRGIKAISLFRTRKIKWEELADFQLTKVTYIQDLDADRAVQVKYASTETPETKTAYGLRTQTFIVVSKSPIKTPADGQLYFFYHKHIAGENNIAFEYSSKAYDLIKANAPITLRTRS